MRSQSKLLKITTLLWITWPGLVAVLLRNEPHDFLGYALKHYFFYPPSIDYIANYWLLNDAVWKRVYVNAWCINGYVLMVTYVWYLLYFDQSKAIQETRKTSILKLLAMGSFAICMSWGFYVGWIFSPEKQLTQKVGVMIYNDIGLVFLFPLVWSAASTFFLGGLALFFVIFLKLFKPNGGAK